MKSVSALTRSAITVALLACSPVNVLTARAGSTNAVKNEPLARAAHRRAAARDEGTYPFEFHSGFWINLHHFLYEQALLRRRGDKPDPKRSSTANPNGPLTPGQQQLWDAAVDYYVRSMVKRDLLFDRELTAINDRLSELEAEPDLSKSGLNADLVKILEGVAPIYRALWWPQHDRANRFWIAAVTPLVRQFGRTLISQLTNAYKAKWPADTIRVEVAEYANWAGAYTSFDRADRVHTTLCSIESGNQSFAGLEILFHEASHSMVDPNNGAVARAIARESDAKNRPVPKDLWHAIIFYTAGEFVRRDLSEYGVSDYTPVAYRGLYARAWPNLQRPLELYWQPYLDGTVDFDKAVSNLVNAL